MRISGAKNATCGPKTASPRPVADPPADAFAEDAAHERRRGDHVPAVPVGRPLRLVDRRVLAGHLERVEARLEDVLVDPGDEVAQVLLELDADRAVVLAGVDLGLEVL